MADCFRNHGCAVLLQCKVCYRISCAHRSLIALTFRFSNSDLFQSKLFVKHNFETKIKKNGIFFWRIHKRWIRFTKTFDKQRSSFCFYKQLQLKVRVLNALFSSCRRRAYQNDSNARNLSWNPIQNTNTRRFLTRWSVFVYLSKNFYCFQSTAYQKVVVDSPFGGLICLLQPICVSIWNFKRRKFDF